MLIWDRIGIIKNMAYKREYGNIIWTNHAIDRMRDRGLTQERAWEAFRYPDDTIIGKNQDGSKFKKKFDKYLVTVIAKQNEKKEWIVISAWIDPPVPGSLDSKQRQEYKEYKKASGFKKFLLEFKKQLGF